MSTRQALKRWVEQAKSKMGAPQVDYATHKPTDGELNNICYMSMKLIMNWPMRGVDFQMVKMMGGDPATVNDLSTKFIPELAEYMWDHLMGEPTELSVEDLVPAIEVVRDLLYTMDEKGRNDIGG